MNSPEDKRAVTLRAEKPSPELPQPSLLSPNRLSVSEPVLTQCGPWTSSPQAHVRNAGSRLHLLPAVSAALSVGPACRRPPGLGWVGLTSALARDLECGGWRGPALGVE